MKNFLNYTELTYDEIKKSVVSRLSEDSRFANFRESEMYAVLMEIFTATTDFTNYYIERRAEESFLDSAQLRSSIILLSKMLGYVIRRPTPATTNIKITIKSVPDGMVAGNSITFPKYSKFLYNGIKYILKDSLSYTLTQSDISNFAAYSDFYLEFNNFSTEQSTYGQLKQIFDTDEPNSPIKLIQGEMRTYTVLNSNNDQLAKPFQVYKIDDTEFSNFYGSEDVGYSYTTGDVSVTNNITRVALGTDINTAFSLQDTDFDNNREFIIDRRSFLNNSSIPELTNYDSGQFTKFCVIRTNMDDSVELMFADDIIGATGAKNTENIYIRYLATKGSTGNSVGIIGQTIIYQDYQAGVTQNNIGFTFTSNSVGGADIESIDSIKINTPEVFYSLERCVTPRDYVSFLKTIVLTTKQTKNAIAWGEQEETREIYSNKKVANIKLFNVVLFSVLADMYAKTGTKYTHVDSDTNVIVDEESENNNWFKLLVMSDSVTPLRENFPVTGDLKNIYDKLYTRSQITVKNVYVKPIIQDFYVNGSIYLNPLVDKIQAEEKIKDSMYNYLSNKVDFNTPVYISNLIDLVENFPEVNHADIYFSAKDVVDELTTFTSTIPASGVSDISAIFNSKPIGCVFNSQINDFDKCNIRDYSYPVPGDKTCYDLYRQVFDNVISAANYDTNTINAIYCLMPNFDVRAQKIDSTDVRYSIVWPYDNLISEYTCGKPYVSNDSTLASYSPSERNLFLSVMKCYYDKLKTIADSSTQTYLENNINLQIEELMNAGSFCACSLREILNRRNDAKNVSECNQYIKSANPNNIKHFLDNYFVEFLKILRNSLVHDIRKEMLNSYGNISNYSMRNEIARIDLSLTNFSYK
jgi:hypothetical protein